MIRLTENRLRSIVRGAVRSVLREGDEHWPSDINPKAIEGFRKDCKEEDIARMNQRIEEYTEIIRKAAHDGLYDRVKYYSKQLYIIAKSINDYNLEDFRKAWQEQDNAMI